jgi:hypothetical protein
METKMTGMRALTRDHRLQALSVPDITEPFEDAAIALSRVFEFNGRKLKAGPLLNAIVMRFLEMSEKEQAEFAGEYLARLELLLAEDDNERVAAMNRLTAPSPKAWPKGPVRDLTPSGPKHPSRKPAEPPIVNHTKVITDPKGGKRKSSG